MTVKPEHLSPLADRLAEVLLERDALLRRVERYETCTCPSGDGSLLWPCYIHTEETFKTMRDERDALKEEVGKLHTRVHNDMEKLVELEADRNELIAECDDLKAVNALLVEALVPWLEHKPSCYFANQHYTAHGFNNGATTQTCTCGLQEALAAVKGEPHP